MLGRDVVHDAEEPRPAKGSQVVHRLHAPSNGADVLSTGGIGDEDLADHEEGVEAKPQIDHGANIKTTFCMTDTSGTNTNLLVTMFFQVDAGHPSQ